MIWEDASTANYTAEMAVINGHIVMVCSDDEAVYVGTHAYYWDIDNRAVDGWAGSVRQARKEAVAAARSMEPITDVRP